MSRAASSKSARLAKTSWTSVAFIVESILLLVFLVGSLAVLTQLFVTSLNQSVKSRTLDAATIAASTIAEHFAADPSDVADEVQLGDLKVTCQVSEEPHDNGTLYVAHIDVFDLTGSSGDESVYSLETARYETREA